MDPPLRVRLNCLDHYQAVPIDELDPPVPRTSVGQYVRERPRVSVIRVFGATETGQKVLMHVHGAFQYTYIEYSGSLAPEDVDVAIKTLQLSIDHALAISYRKNFYDGNHPYVAHISLVKGIPFYGYHVGYKFYLKIYLLNPLHMTRLADLLREGAVMKRVLQPYESHMQYLAQWMCDYNLYGCGYIECDKVKFRSPVPRYLDLDNELHYWHDRSIDPNFISDEAILPKQSHCSLEVDVCVQDIVNRRTVEPRYIHHDFVERKHPLSIDAKLVQSMAGLWRDETRRRKARMGLIDPSSSPFPPEVLITMSADPRDNSIGGWIHEEEYRQKIARIAEKEYQNSEIKELSFDSFLKPVMFERKVQTAFESVEDLYPRRNVHPFSDDRDKKHEEKIEELASSQAVIDESTIRQVAGLEGTRYEKSRIVEALRATPDLQTTSDQSSSAIGSNNSVPTSSPPINSSEYAQFGVLKIGNPSHMDGDKFEMSGGFISAKVLNDSQITKRARSNDDEDRESKKRRTVLTDEWTLPPSYQTDNYASDAERQPQTVESVPLNVSYMRDFAARLHQDDLNEQIANEGSTDDDIIDQPQDKSQRTLAFPIVKDPQDPNTLLRLSQHSTSSQPDLKMISQSDPRTPETSNTPLKKQTASSQGPLTTPATVSSTDRSTDHLQLKGLLTRKPHTRIDIYQIRPPSLSQLSSFYPGNGWPDVIYQEAYYSNEDDVPNRAREYAGREFKLKSTTVPYLPEFNREGTSPAIFGKKVTTLINRPAEEFAARKQRRLCKLKQWTILSPPPSRDEVESWLESERKKSAVANGHRRRSVDPKMLSQIDGPTQKNEYGCKYSQKRESTNVRRETQYMSIMSLEVHVNTRGSLAPNPEYDEVASIFWSIQNDDEEAQSTTPENLISGILVLSPEPGLANRIARSTDNDVEEESTELDLLTRLVDIVRLYDPDILTGYEVHNSSWGYLIERARVKYDLNYCDQLSRMKSQSHGRFGKDDDKWGFNHTSTIRVTGRHTINVWRAMRSELNLLQYTMENVTFHLLQRRIPHYSFADLTKWYGSKIPRDFVKVVDYFSSRVKINLAILQANELVPRTSEQARLLGVDWFSVISRGSQFKVESLMFRIAKPENFILVSPSRRQVGGQNALECLPLVMEPQSDFYTSPLLVLDFQSLYPSVMIAYNYCYSTFLGRIVGWRGTNKMGFTDYQRQERLIELLKDWINIAPNGIMYVKPQIRKSLLAKMLSEILETRVMVKSGMKEDKDDKTLQQLLNNRQLALKLIANVTYGYTSASFSGRMPCSEIADSIVQTARETLEKTIALIHSVERWGAEVVYGDTDSLFVYLKGRSRDQAFDIGEEIAETITNMNPRPLKLKFEKVYHPCVLLAKKRYVGFKYEHRNQTEPEFDAKGIETVRRDGTPAEQKIEENALKILFRTSDLSKVKAFFQAQCSKIMRGKISIQDFCFAREVKLGTYSEKGPPPPGALISTRRMLEDPRLEPQYGERVPYVVITGGPRARLIDRCVAPEVLLNDAQLELDAEYYISKNLIPPLERIFNLVGANVRQWYDEMPKIQRIRSIVAGFDSDGLQKTVSKKTLESYLKPSACMICRGALDTKPPICNSCLAQAPQSVLHLRAKLTRAERRTVDVARVCRSCSNLAPNEEVRCDSKDCPVFYSRMRYKTELSTSRGQVYPALEILLAKGKTEMEW